MKRFIIIFALFTSILTVNAQGSFSVTEGQPTVVYSLPKTELSVEIEVEKRHKSLDCIINIPNVIWLQTR